MKSGQCNHDTPRVRLRGVPGGGDQLAEHLEEVFDRVRVSRAEGWERVCELHPRRRTPRIVTPEAVFVRGRSALDPVLPSRHG